MLLYKNILLTLSSRKGCRWSYVRGELEMETDCHILTPSSSDHSSTSFAFWLGCSTGGHWGPKPSVWSWFSLHGHLISNCDWNSLPQTVCGTWLYNCLMPTYFLWAYASAPNSTTSTGQGDIPTSSTGCTCLSILLLIYTGASLDWRLGRGHKYCNFITEESGILVLWKLSTADNTLPLFPK